MVFGHARRHSGQHGALRPSACTAVLGSFGKHSSHNLHEHANDMSGIINAKTAGRRRVAVRTTADAYRCVHENMWPPTEASSVWQTTQPPGGRRGRLSFLEP